MSYAYAPLYGYSDSSTDPATGYTHTHAVYADAYGTYERVFDEERGPAFDRTYQYTSSYDAGVYARDVLSTSTPLDGSYQSYGTRYTSTYDLTDATTTTTDVSFSAGYSYSVFHSMDYDTGATTASYDARWFYAGGYYDYRRTSYDGPGGSTYSAGGAYYSSGGGYSYSATA